MSSVVFSPVMEAREWRAAAAAHEARAGRYADPFAQRRARHEVHPVEDFLFTYYTLKPGQFKRWHPGDAARPGTARVPAREYGRVQVGVQAATSG